MTNPVLSRALALLPALLLALLLSGYAAAPSQALSLTQQQQQQPYHQYFKQPLQSLHQQKRQLTVDEDLPAFTDHAAYGLEEPSSAAAARHAGGIINGWLTYNKRALPHGLSEERLVLLDNVLSAMLRNVYKDHLPEQQLTQLPRSAVNKRKRKSQEERIALARRSAYGDLPVRGLDEREKEGEEEEEDTPRLQYAETSLRLGRRSREQLLAQQKKAPPKRNHQQKTSKQETEIRQSQQSPANAVAAASAGMASQFLLRSARGNRIYDVPQIECPVSDEGMERFACPTADRIGRYRCIDDHVLCDGFIDCPQGEDEDRQGCMFYKTTKAHLDVLADALLRWARGRR
ncbi:uncharacterized protein LOC106636241 [Copidosoma floridanum]|uniref:uncharacterized protein LOC106636241 n=1 Tax=Copidosoma floridanum TaxID=29053 RepID=UPI0006C93D53|nr:uncharacterized protein LOC106636241 [Copidosoma floridanum]